MPTLKQLTVSLEVGPHGSKLREYAHRFTDGGVDTFVAVPTDCPGTPFAVHITSQDFIAPGLAAYVFIDGRYQCNRNRQRLRNPGIGVDRREYEIDFLLRQKEERSGDGEVFVARDWTFGTLRIADADHALAAPDGLAGNVGTIEVVILRCKDGAGKMPPPAYTTIAPPGPSCVVGFGARSTGRRSEPLPLGDGKAASYASFKAQAKEPSKAGSGKISAAGSGGFGGMAGLFDGPGDAPGYYLDQPGYGSYRDDRSRMPFEPARHAPRPHSGYGFHDRGPREQGNGGHYDRQRVATDQPGHQDSLGGAYGYQPPRRPSSQLPQQMHPEDMNPSARQHAGMGNPAVPEAFPFIQDMCNQIEILWRLQHSASKKLAGLEQEARLYRNDPEMHLIALKAVRQKRQELQDLDQDHNALVVSIFMRMRRMDHPAWLFCRDYIVLEKRLIPPNHPEIMQWHDPRLARLPPEPSAFAAQRAVENAPRPGQPWQQVGQGQVRQGEIRHGDKKPYESLYDFKRRQQDEQMNRHREQQGNPGWGQQDNPGWGPQNPRPQNGNGWQSRDAVDQPQNNNSSKNNNPNNRPGQQNGPPKLTGWESGDAIDEGKHMDFDAVCRNDQGGKQDNSGNNDNWGDDKNDSRSKAQSHKSHKTAAWGAEGDNNDNNNQPDAWGNENQNFKPESDKLWGGGGGGGGGGENWAGDNNNNNAQQDTWGANADAGEQDNWKRDETKSQGHQSKVATWNDGRSKKQAADAWDKPASKANPPSAPPTQLEPIIKPYWADWGQTSPAPEAKLRARDPYEYPPPPAPTVRASKAGPASPEALHAGRGASYAHKTYRPQYLDSMEKPYAVFTFKYRSQAALEKLLKRSIGMEEVRKAVREAEEERLMGLPKDLLVQKVMRMNLGGDGGGSGSGSGNGKDKGKGDGNASSANPKAEKKDEWGNPVDSANADNNSAWGKQPPHAFPSHDLAAHDSNTNLQPLGQSGDSSSNRGAAAEKPHDGGAEDKAAVGDGGWAADQAGAGAADDDDVWKSSGGKSQLGQKGPPTPEHFAADDGLQTAEAGQAADQIFW